MRDKKTWKVGLHSWFAGLMMVNMKYLLCSLACRDFIPMKSGFLLTLTRSWLRKRRIGSLVTRTKIRPAVPTEAMEKAVNRQELKRGLKVLYNKALSEL